VPSESFAQPAALPPLGDDSLVEVIGVSQGGLPRVYLGGLYCGCWQQVRGMVHIDFMSGFVP
jgi:hypothetical protein